MQNTPPLAEPRAGPLPVSNPDNPFGTGREVGPAARTGLVSVEQQRAIAEIQARLIVARANPRDPIRAVDLILNDCCRVTLAERAVYQYARGGTDIRGPTIRLAEAIAQRWGNIASGIKEIARHDGYSECVAYAWDLESGFYDERQFQIRHWRDTRQGGYVLTDERDIYELIANNGQRRKRAVLLTIVPGDVTEAALAQCEKTMHASADVTPEGVAKLIEAFATFGVVPQQIEKRIQRRLDAIRPAQVVQLRQVYNSLSDGMSEPADWFEPIGAVEQPQAETQSGQAAPPTAGSSPPAANPTARRGRGRPPGPRHQPSQPDEGQRAAPPAGEAGGAGTPAAPPPQPAQPEQPKQSRFGNFEV